MAETRSAVARGARDLSLRLVEKALMPIVAAAASAATGYAARRVREALESGVSAHADGAAAGTGASPPRAGSTHQLEQRRAARARGRAARRKAIST